MKLKILHLDLETFKGISDFPKNTFHRYHQQLLIRFPEYLNRIPNL